MFACLVPPMLTGCASSPSNSRAVVFRDLPAPPDYLRPVKPPSVTAGQDPKALAGQALVALDKANTRLANAATWYAAIRAEYADPKSSAGGANP